MPEQEKPQDEPSLKEGKDQESRPSEARPWPEADWSDEEVPGWNALGDYLKEVGGYNWRPGENLWSDDESRAIWCMGYVEALLCTAVSAGYTSKPEDWNPVRIDRAVRQFLRVIKDV